MVGFLGFVLGGFFVTSFWQMAALFFLKNENGIFLLNFNWFVFYSTLTKRTVTSAVI